MGKRNNLQSPLEKELRKLLDALCVEWGFCIPPGDADRIATSSVLTADDFAKEVLKAEGMYLEQHTEWYGKIRQRFIDRFGESVSKC